MNKYDSEVLDKIAFVALTNLYSKSKDIRRIELRGFNPYDKNHLGLLQIAHKARIQFGYEVVIRMNWFKFIAARLNGCLPYNEKFAYRLKSKDPIWCNQFIAHITNANDCPDAFVELI